MKVINNPIHVHFCECGAILEYDNRDIKRVGNQFRGEYEDYIVCPNCHKKIILKTGCVYNQPYS